MKLVPTQIEKTCRRLPSGFKNIDNLAFGDGPVKNFTLQFLTELKTNSEIAFRALINLLDKLIRQY